MHKACPVAFSFPISLKNIDDMLACLAIAVKVKQSKRALAIKLFVQVL